MNTKQNKKNWFLATFFEGEQIKYCTFIYRSEKETKYLVLVATSGDTGSAVLQGFQNCENVSVMVLYPEQGISSIQRQQMTSMDAKNIKVIGVEADFDFCQSEVKQIFTGRLLLCGYKFSLVNSHATFVLV